MIKMSKINLLIHLLSLDCVCSVLCSVRHSSANFRFPVIIWIYLCSPSSFVRRLRFSAVSVCPPSSADCPPSLFLCRLRLSAVFSWLSAVSVSLPSPFVRRLQLILCLSIVDSWSSAYRHRYISVRPFDPVFSWLCPVHRPSTGDLSSVSSESAYCLYCCAWSVVLSC